MGVLTVASCGATSALICDRINSIVDLFNPVNGTGGISPHFRVQFPEAMMIAMLGTISAFIYLMAFTGSFPYNLSTIMENGGLNFGRSDPYRRRHKRAAIEFTNVTSLLILRDQFDYIEDIIQSMKIVDTNKCFEREICRINKRRRKVKAKGQMNLIDAYRQFEEMDVGYQNGNWDEIHEFDGLASIFFDEDINCDEKYKMCKL